MKNKALSLGTMFILLVLAVAILPLFIRYLSAMEPHFVISGFQDLHGASVQQDNRVLSVPSQGSTASLPVWRPDPNTDYICRSPNGSDQPCPEGTFCDGPTQSCVSKYVGGPVPTEGYFA
jgi:hypothetical protein